MKDLTLLTATHTVQTPRAFFTNVFLSKDKFCPILWKKTVRFLQEKKDSLTLVVTIASSPLEPSAVLHLESTSGHKPQRGTMWYISQSPIMLTSV